jgi:multiple antibiotic resistance protein|tara:strand:- start:184 stop:759 length:576 start_codon:yes stop_codon:yes gene_type:complete
MNLDSKEIFTASLVLFAVINMIGSIPIIISLRQKVGHIQSEKASIVAGVIMIGFLFVGKNILNLIGIDVNSFAVAGSLIIFFIALEMIMGISIYKNDVPETASIVPIAFPIIAGPGSLTTLLSLRAEFELINIIMAVICNIIIVYLILKSTNLMSKILGKSGIAVIQKVFGIILLSIAVKLFATNVGQIIN